MRKLPPHFLKVICIASSVVLAQPDTLVVNQTEYRFPETHPGKTFLVKKVIVNGEGALGKSAAQVNPQGKIIAPFKSLVGRDALGRRIRRESYHAKLATLRAKHSLPLYAHDESPKAGQGKAFKLTTRIPRYNVREDSRFVLLSDSPLLQGARDLERMEREERRALRGRYGAVHPEFAKKLEKISNEKDSLDVIVHLKITHPGFINRALATLEEKKANARAWLNARPGTSKSDLVAKYGLKEILHARVAQGDRTTLAVRTTKKTVLELSRNPDVAAITENQEIKPATVPGSGPTDFNALIASAYNPANEMVNYGGTSVATMEGGLRPSFVSCLNYSLQPVLYDSNMGFEPQHAEGTYYLLAAGTPDSYRYHFRGNSFSSIQDSIINYGINTISVSMIGAWNSETYPDVRLIDRFPYIYPYTLFSLPTGNYGHSYVPEHRSYNGLIVGNVQHYDNITYTVDIWKCCDQYGQPFIGPSSQSKNPPARYGSYDDRELPYLVAPGFTADPWWGIQNACIVDSTGYQGLWGPGGGTSFSAPVTAAIAGNLIGASNYWLAYRPEMTRAALLVTAENADSGYWDPSNHDARDGAGVISGANAVKFVTGEGLYETFYNPGPGNVEGPVISGFDADANPSFESYESYYYLTPPELPSGMHLRAVLTWNSSPGVNYNENEVSDLGLYVETDNMWYVSDSWNGNVEMVDILNEDLAPDTEYEIRVVPSIYRQATDGPEDVYYSIAWTWVKDHAD